MSRIDERLAALGLTRNQIAARMADDEGWNLGPTSESLGKLISCLNSSEPDPYLTFQPRELTAACKVLRCSSDWLLGLTDDDTRISKNARDRDVAAAFEKGLAATSNRLVLSTAQPGTGAWAWEQMQRGPEVWVRCRGWTDGVSAVHIRSGLVHGCEDSIVGPGAGVTTLAEFDQLYAYATDWELCAAPGSKEAKRAEFHALAANAPETPLTAPSAKDGPTVEQVIGWYQELFGKLGQPQTRIIELCAMSWQATREGMVPRSELDTARYRFAAASTRADTAERRVGELERDAEQLVAARDAEVQRHGEAEQRCYDTAAERDELRVELKSTSAELERVKQQVLGLLRGDSVPGDPNDLFLRVVEEKCLDRDRTSAELERVKAELGTWNVWGGTYSLMGLTPAAARDSIASDLTELVAANDALAQIENLCGSDEELEPYEVVGLVRKRLLTPASDEVTEGEARALSKEASDAASKVNSNPDSHEWDREYTHTLIRLARRNHGGNDENAGLLRAECANWREWAGDRAGTTNPEEYTDEELRQGVDKASLMRLPLSDEQRIELADAARKAQYPGLKLKDFALIDGERQAEWLASVDAIAPRITRAGVELRELSNEEAVTAVAAGALGGGATLQSLCGHIARAILAAAQGGDVGQEQRDTISKPPRGRKLTDGEQGLLVGLCDAYRKTPSGDSWRAILACVESLLAPQESVPPWSKPTLDDYARLRARALGNDSILRWDNLNKMGQENWGSVFDELYEAGRRAPIAPQDEVRVALGVCVLDLDWRNVAGDAVFIDDEPITQALSASPGDKFEFSVVARRVE